MAYALPRLPYDVDRTGVYLADLDAHTTVQLDPTTVTDLNGLRTGVLDSAQRLVGPTFLFPEPRSITGVRVYSDGGGMFSLATSETAVTEEDLQTVDDWVSSAAMPCATGFDFTAEIQDFAVERVRCLSVYNIGAAEDSGGMGSVHIFGSPYVGVDQLAIWDPHLDVAIPAATLDWGTVNRAESADLKFRVKNLSTSYTANGISVGLDDQPSGIGLSLAGQQLLSIDGLRFNSRISISALSPGQVSSPITLRRVLASTADLGTWSYRVVATPTSWS